jgi:hypothetical protein
MAITHLANQRGKLLDAATTTGAGTAYRLHNVSSNYTCQVIVTTDGTLSAITVDLETSLDGTNWAAVASHTFSAAEITAKHAIFHVVDKPIHQVRVICTFIGYCVESYPKYKELVLCLISMMK